MDEYTFRTPVKKFGDSLVIVLGVAAKVIEVGKGDEIIVTVRKKGPE